MPAPAFDVHALGAVLDRLSGGRPRRYRVAFSGGLDSTVLLAAAAELFPGGVSAVHVDHGLHPGSGAWAEACATRCAELGIPLHRLRVDARARPGQSPEAAARVARYSAIEAMLGPGEVLLTAHHADDQIETVLLQLMRGAGPRGLAGMPEAAAFGAGSLWRPLLGFDRNALAAWAAARRLGWVDDPANADLRRARNHLRHEVVPALKAYWPSAAATIARSARHCAEAADLLDELAEADAARCGDGEGLCVAALSGLSRARRANVVRWDARRRGLPVPDERRLGTLLDQVASAGPDTLPRVAWPGALAARYQGRLYLMPDRAAAPAPGRMPWPDPAEPLALGEGLGVIALEETDQGGLNPAVAASRECSVAFRRGGERLRLPGRAHRSDLKKLFNAARVPPWERARTPLVMVAGELAAVGERWVAARWWRPPGNKALRVAWTPDGEAF